MSLLIGRRLRLLLAEAFGGNGADLGVADTRLAQEIRGRPAQSQVDPAVGGAGEVPNQAASAQAPHLVGSDVDQPLWPLDED